MIEEVKLQLKKNANIIRMDVIEQVHSAKSGHPGGSLSIADIMAYLYFVEMNIDPKNPKWAERDRFVLSKGHTCPALYSALAVVVFLIRTFYPLSGISAAFCRGIRI